MLAHLTSAARLAQSCLAAHSVKLGRFGVLLCRQPVAPTDIHLSVNRSFHALTVQPINTISSLLPITSSQVVPSCGMKMKRALRRRCKDCYLVYRQNRPYIMCPTHPRHKQMGLVRHPKTQWILTSVINSPRRPW